MEISYDPDTDSIDIKFQKARYAVSEEVAEGVIVDYTEDGGLISIEILDASKRMPKESITDILVRLPQSAA
ncbi:MAG: DUF2283 domain-containing protein [Chloroflexi bacterium]|nr:DUF2283 domain-containing protein [Chloroflexota bacterium]